MNNRSHMNFKNMAPDGNDGRPPPPGNFSLARQPSIYSLTFDEFQNTVGSIGKDFGSMNMDEFLKNIWTAEETQAMASAAFGVASEGGVAGGSLQRQGSLTLPRTLSQKTVDEVWRDIFKENGGKDAGGNSPPNLQQRQQTLGEMTLEEFLVRAGVVREDPQPTARPNNNGGFYGELLQLSNNMGLGLGFPDRSNEIGINRVLDNNSQISNQSPHLPMNVNGVRSSHQERPRQQLYPKQATMGYAPSMQFTSNADAGNSVIKNGIMGIGDHPAINNGFVQGGGVQLQGGGGGMGMVGLGAGGATVAIESPSQLSSDGLGKSNGDTSSLSPAPYVFNGGLRGRKCSGTVEKVVERRQRRMIKNRESAARSRARKQVVVPKPNCH